MRKYPKYKDSGVEWLFDVPENWDIWKMKFLSRIETGNKNTEDAEENGEYPFYVRSDNVERISTYSFDGEAILTAGDGVGVAKVFHYANCKMAIHQRVYKISNFKKVIGPFLYYYIRDNFEKEVIKLSAKTTVDSLRMPMLGNFPIAYPSKEEQHSIVRFLDHKTRQMDSFLGKRQKQIELLKEQKAGIINKAVTKGIDPTAKMKPSGIEWIGDIPEDWIIIKLKYIIKTMASGVSVNSTDEPAEANEYGILKTSCVYTGEFNPNQNKKIDENEYKRMACPVKGNSIIISRMNTPELVGANGFVDKDYEDLFLPDRLWQTVFFKKAEIVPKWLSYFLSSNRFRKLLSSLATGTSASMKNITQEDVLGSFICLPSIDEQNAMIAFFEEESSAIDILISKYQKQIDLMQEYRTSIISQAVTGKIDVREWEPRKKKYKTEELESEMVAEK